MANYKVVNADQLDSDLENIASKIREKTGNSQALTFPEGFISEISAIETGGEEIPAEAFHLTGNLELTFAHNKWAFLINNYGDKITTSGINNLSRTFYYSGEIERIPFELNCDSTKDISLGFCFYYCGKLKEIPKINNCRPSSLASTFYGISELRYLPENINDWFDWSSFETKGLFDSTFYMDYSLRSIPMDFLNHGSATSGYYALYNNTFKNCYVLDELIDFPVNTNGIPTRNLFDNTFSGCYRLKDLIFATRNGTPYVAQWTGQTIDLTSVGYGTSDFSFTAYNSGITTAKSVTNDSTYYSLRNDPDWYTTNVYYSRYNHDSAVNTINSLPDTSAYLATKGGTNTIKFKGSSGSSTDGGAINTLTEAEIAVATAKGWTVTLS
jgi:hypothetical protein